MEARFVGMQEWRLGNVHGEVEAVDLLLNYSFSLTPNPAIQPSNVTLMDVNTPSPRMEPMFTTENGGELMKYKSGSETSLLKQFTFRSSYS